MIRFDWRLCLDRFGLNISPFLFLHLFVLWVNVLKFLKFYIIVLLDVWVKAIFDFILRAARQTFADLRPLAANFAEKLQDFPIFLLRPVLSFDTRVQFINVSLTNLLAIFGAKHFRDEFPVLSIFFDKLEDSLILLWGPYLVTFAKLDQSSISVKALILVSVCH